MYEIVMYEDARGYCPVQEWIKELDGKALRNKRARIELNQVRHYMKILERFGTRLGDQFTKQIDGELWELRPGGNRIFFFGWRGNHFVLLHSFPKETQKTPTREIEQAEREMQDWIMRHRD